jgi:hypothetical protein
MSLTDNAGQWLPVPLIVSNPTIGTAFEPILLYMHPRKADSTHNATTGLVGMYSDTKSWFTGAFHDGSSMGDSVRYFGFLGTGHMNLNFYGIGDGGLIGDRSIPYEFDALVTTMKLQKRIADTSNWFVGVQYIYLDSETTIKTSSVMPGIDDITGKISTGGLGVLATYDTRDDNYYPTQGLLFEGKWLDYGENWGGDNEYSKSSTFINHYQSVRERTVLALRARLMTSSGDVPFFDLPTLQMSGFSRDRYRDENTLSLHSEVRYKYKPRWGVVGFYEVGWYNAQL